MAVRLGWVSQSTGLTYCGICFGTAVAPEIGAECPACGAQVSRLLDLRAEGKSINQAWNDALLLGATRSEPQKTGSCGMSFGIAGADSAAGDPAIIENSIL